MSCLSHSTCSFSIDDFSESVMEKSFRVKSANSLAGLQSIAGTGVLMLDLSDREKSSFASDNVWARLTECVSFTASSVQEK